VLAVKRLGKSELSGVAVEDNVFRSRAHSFKPANEWGTRPVAIVEIGNPPEQTKLGWGTHMMVGWATRPTSRS